ncbi:N-(5'-phosphoribosyl)anthranilate isomerase [Siccirubricoccus deserti]|uniref:N-(5'-phosphoribosyl)anthranilate isomerase n=1 Tax=Siccirubricoccus deserti TaxID=2013562 RepID=A0A9X0R0T7_9PROT|nr:phosphoribosylanthranilate isomerase [Siccirubricoccus deserti]MBC4016778.1 phosphoribosylanthranilate isomerase [Siccirubricoccus deserti]GGC51416.1 N-(5'-phosphoribosyl)anthranilate isomerase [Siccirubricoccus deserti]
MTLVKICGVSDPAGFDAALAAGADMLGFVFYPPSPRALTPAAAAALSSRAEGGPLRVGLFVDPEDALIEAVLAALPLGLIQLHGAEDPARCAAIRARFGLPVMKALGIAEPADLMALADYAPAVDRFLLDAKPPPGATLPGGNAAAFDWRLTAGRAIPRPWLLAGGLTPDTVAEAIRQSGAPGVDVSSGVERARGVKDPARIAAFVAAARLP